MPTNVVVDANILISALIGKTISRYFDRLLNSRALNNIQLYYTDYLITEVNVSLQKPSLQKLIDPDKAALFIENFKLAGRHILIDMTTLPSISRDPKDNYLLTLSEKAKADYLITGDGDLLTIKHHQSTQIVSFAIFNASFFGE